MKYILILKAEVSNLDVYILKPCLVWWVQLSFQENEHVSGRTHLKNLTFKNEDDER